MLSNQIVSAKEQVDFNLEKTHPIIKKHQALKKEHDVLEKEFKEYKKIVSKNSDAQKELDKELASKNSMEAELLDLQAKENKLTTEIQELKDKTLGKKTEKENAKKAQEEEKKKQEDAKKKASQTSSNNTSTTSTTSSQPAGSVRLANGNTAGEQGLYAAQKMSELTGVPASTWEHIIARESNGQVDAYNPSGASGLFQTMPGWGSTATVEDQIQAAYRAYSAQGLSAWGY